MLVAGGQPAGGPHCSLKASLGRARIKAWIRELRKDAAPNVATCLCRSRALERGHPVLGDAGTELHELRLLVPAAARSFDAESTKRVLECRVVQSVCVPVSLHFTNAMSTDACVSGNSMIPESPQSCREQNDEPQNRTLRVGAPRYLEKLRRVECRVRPATWRGHSHGIGQCWVTPTATRTLQSPSKSPCGLQRTLARQRWRMR